TLRAASMASSAIAGPPTAATSATTATIIAGETRGARIPGKSCVQTRRQSRFGPGHRDNEIPEMRKLLAACSIALTGLLALPPAATNTGVGLAGAAPDAKMLAIRSLDANGGSFEEIAAGVRWATDHGADVINLSLGALPGVQALVITGLVSDVQDAIAYARSKGVVVVAAAGNETAPLCDTPGSDDGALCVVATDKRELHAAYSNFGIK